MDTFKAWALAGAAALLLCGCSNGTGSVDERASAPAASDTPAPVPPPAPSPTPTPPTPTPQPPPAQPPSPSPQPPPPTPPAPTPQPPAPVSSALAGWWEGTAREGDTNKRGVAFIDHLGDMQIMIGGDAQPEMVLHGNVCCKSSVDMRVNGQRFAREDTRDVQLKASIVNGQLSGEFEYRGEHTFALTPNAGYRQPLTLTRLAGVYTHTETPLFGAPVTLTLSITATGELTGAHTNGCTYNGRASIPDSASSMIRMDVDITGCGSRFSSDSEWNGKYRGLAVLRGPQRNTLYLSLVGPTWLGAQSLMR